jgi:hypothetical protein
VNVERRIESRRSNERALPVVAASDAALAQDQIAIFKALGGGWQ